MSSTPSPPTPISTRRRPTPADVEDAAEPRITDQELVGEPAWLDRGLYPPPATKTWAGFARLLVTEAGSRWEIEVRPVDYIAIQHLTVTRKIELEGEEELVDEVFSRIVGVCLGRVNGEATLYLNGDDDEDDHGFIGFAADRTAAQELASTTAATLRPPISSEAPGPDNEPDVA